MHFNQTLFFLLVYFEKEEKIFGKSNFKEFFQNIHINIVYNSMLYRTKWALG